MNHMNDPSYVLMKGKDTFNNVSMHEEGQEEGRDPFPLQHSPATLSDC